MTFVVADDDAALRTLLSVHLERAFPSRNVRAAADGQAALRIIEHSRPSLLVVDLDMPRMTGLQLVSELYERGSTKDLPIVVMSGTCSASEWRALSRLGADRLLLKPFSPPQLVDLIRRLLPTPVPSGAAE